METDEQNITKVKGIRNLFLFILGSLGIGAIGGGIILILSPAGELLGIPFSTYENSPFNSYLIPGIFLLSVLGLVPLLVVLGLLKKPTSIAAEKLNAFKDMHWSWTYSIYLAFILICWIHIQLIFLQSAVHWLHTFYMGYAILILIIALTPQMRSLYKNGPL